MNMTPEMQRAYEEEERRAAQIQKQNHEQKLKEQLEKINDNFVGKGGRSSGGSRPASGSQSSRECELFFFSDGVLFVY
jgi:hypothetical protein